MAWRLVTSTTIKMWSDDWFHLQWQHMAWWLIASIIGVTGDGSYVGYHITILWFLWKLSYDNLYWIIYFLWRSSHDNSIVLMEFISWWILLQGIALMDYIMQKFYGSCRGHSIAIALKIWPRQKASHCEWIISCAKIPIAYFQGSSSWADLFMCVQT